LPFGLRYRSPNGNAALRYLRANGILANVRSGPIPDAAATAGQS
jgi:hypothetical protein